MTGAAGAGVLALTAAAILAWPERDALRAPRGPTRPSLPTQRRAVLSGLLVAGSMVVLAPDLWWLALPAGLLVAAAPAVDPSRLSRRTNPRHWADLAEFCDLLAACLEAGMAVSTALRAVASVLPARRGAPGATSRAVATGAVTAESGVALGAARERDRPDPVTTLDAVAAMLDLGADPDLAWRVCDPVPELAPLAAAARRTARGGTALADAVRRHAHELRERVDASDAQSAGRAAVVMTAPLALCFLPGFVCLGLAPVVIGLLGQLQIG